MEKVVSREEKPTFFRKYIAELRGNGFTDPPQRTTIDLPPITGYFLKEPVTGQLWFVPNSMSLFKREIQIDVFWNSGGGCYVRAQNIETGAVYVATYDSKGEPLKESYQKAQQLKAFLFGEPTNR